MKDKTGTAKDIKSFGNYQSDTKRNCSVCGKPAFIDKFVLYRPSNIAYYYCEYHWKVSQLKKSETPIKEFWEEWKANEGVVKEKEYCGQKLKCI